MWRNTTFKREVEAAPLEAPASVCGSIVDSPGILAAAASHLGLTNESAELKPDGSFELHSPDGSFAWYRVIWYQPQRRVIVSQGTLVISGFDVRAAVLGELKISTSDGPIRQHLKVFVEVKNPFLSWMARVLLRLLPTIADEELSRGFRLTHRVTTWAATDRNGFCLWLSSIPPTTRSHRIEQVLNCSNGKEQV